MQRVAAYCRVSTDKNDQVNSLESQKKYFAQYIQHNPLWELSEVYVDEGITGTSTKKRAAFNRMISDAQTYCFDLIITKEISRFARNTLDSIFYTRQLKELGIGVIFMNDNINTLDPDAELRLTIMSSIAQEESRKTSERVKWGQKRCMEQGVVFGRDMLGYDVRDGKLYINESGAETVKLIFHKFVNERKGTHAIARELQESNIPTAAYMKQWSNTAILRILRNEKYCGDLIQKKTITPNFLNHEKKQNKGEEELVVIREHHTPIISRELFNQAQQELKRRSLSEKQKSKHSNRYCFSGKIKCGSCGCNYVSRTKIRKDDTLYQAWRCYENARHGKKRNNEDGRQTGCNSPYVNENNLKSILQDIIKNLPVNKESIIYDVCRMIQSSMQTDNENDSQENLTKKMRKIEEKRQSLLELYLNKDINKEDFQRLTAKYNADATKLETQQSFFQTQQKQMPPQHRQFEQIANAIGKLITGDVWDDEFYCNILDKVIIKESSILEINLYTLSQPWQYSVYKR